MKTSFFSLFLTLKLFYFLKIFVFVLFEYVSKVKFLYFRFFFVQPLGSPNLMKKNLGPSYYFFTLHCSASKHAVKAFFHPVETSQSIYPANQYPGVYMMESGLHKHVLIHFKGVFKNI